MTDGKDSHIFCASCGFSAPFVSRQHTRKLQQPRQAQPPERQPQFPTRARQHSPVSVWVDSTISSYPQEEQGEQEGQVVPDARASDTPTRPVPPRASARRAHAVKVRPRYPYARVQPIEEGDLSRIPTMPPPTTWEYESREYTAESSLSSLSLIVDTPTSPHIEGPTATNVLDAPTVPQALYVPETPPLGMPRIEDMDTRPPAISTTPAASNHAPTLPQASANMAPHPQLSSRESAVRSESDPLPKAAALFLGLTGLPEIPSESLASQVSQMSPTRAMIPSAPAPLSSGMVPRNGQVVHGEPVSWTAGVGAGSPYARRLVAHEYERRHLASFNLVDRLRWWLLHPGRFEFLLWLSGMLLLVVVTCVFVLMTVFSFQPGASHTYNGHSRSDSVSGVAYGTPASPIVSSATNVLSAGQPLHLHGQGFSANAEIALSYDANHPFLDQHGQPVIVLTTGQGVFSVTVRSPAWGAGEHRIVARDMATGHSATTLVTVTAASSPTTSTPTVVATATQNTGTGTSSGTTPPSPVNQTPISSPPTVGISPTATPKPPTPTPTTGITPTATTGITPTVGATTTPNTTGTVTNDESLNTQNVITSDPALSGVTAGPWLWFMIGGYALALLLLGCAGLARMKGTGQ